MTDDVKSGKQLTGKKVLLMVVAFFAVIIVANTFMITKSVTSFRGEDTKKSYLQGLHYNDTLEQRAAQQAAGWTAQLVNTDDKVELRILDGNNRPISDLNLQGKLRHPTDTSKDLILAFTYRGDGVYVSNFPEAVSGQRVLITKAETDAGFTFQSRNELWLQ